MIGAADVVQQPTINGTPVKTCDPGKQTAQNETTIAVDRGNPNTLVGGANDYRLYEPSENRYDSSGSVYHSTDGGATWTAAFLPGLVRANSAAPGPYESAGDPAVSAGPAGVFWYSNLLFNRSDNASGVAASRSTDGGATWTTSFVVQTSAAQGSAVFNDKEWVAADPNNPNVAYVTWTQFLADGTSPIVISKTSDGGATWSALRALLAPNSFSQGSAVQVDSAGTVHVTYETFDGISDVLAYTFSTDGGVSFTPPKPPLPVISDIPITGSGSAPWASYRVNSFPALAVDGSSLYSVWADWNGNNADIKMIRSSDGGANWSKPALISQGIDQHFFPAIASYRGKVYASWFDSAATQALPSNQYTIQGAASADAGATWTAPVTISTATSNASLGNLFGFPTCTPNFIGDYSGIAAGADGVAHPLWTDIRVVNSPGSSTNQDPYTATMYVADRYTALSPARILDTRSGLGRCSPSCTTLGGGGSIDVQVTGQGGVPNDGSAAAVVMNVTVTNASGPPSFLTIYPSGDPRPPSSNLNFVGGQTVPNLVQVPLSSGGRVTAYNNAGSVDVIFDVGGYFTRTADGSAGLLHPLLPARIMDTRSGGGSCASPSGACATLGPNGSLDLQVAGSSGVPTTGAAAVVLNVTVTNATGPLSFLTVYPTGGSRPEVSNLNFVAGQTVPNRVTVMLGPGGKVTFYNNAGSVDVIVDVGAYYTDASGSGSGGAFTPLTPARILDTRAGSRTGICAISCSTLGPGSTLNLTVAGQGGVPAMGSATPPSAVVMNVTVADATGPLSFLTVYPSGAGRPLASDLNFLAGQTVPNLVLVKLGPDGTVNIYNDQGTTEVVADVFGWYN